MRTALARRPVKLDADGKAIANVERFEVPLPGGMQAAVRIAVGWFPANADGLPGMPIAGWHAEATLTGRRWETGRSAAGRERWHSIVDAAEALANRLVDVSDRARGNERKWLNGVIAALNQWTETFEKQSRKDLAMTSKSKGITVVDATCEPTEHDSEERRQVLKEFRKAWSAFDRSWRGLGEKALRVRDTQAWREEGHLTFEDWIVAEKRPTSIIYQSMHAVRMERLALPVAERLKVVIDRESHFRSIPARINGEEITPDEVKDIVKQLAKTVEAAADGLKHAKASDVKAAVKAINETQDYSDEQLRKDRLQAKWDEEDRKRQAAAMGEAAPRLAPETITGDYREVVSDAPPPPRPVPMVNLGVQDRWHLAFAPEDPSDGSDPGYWNGQPHPEARKLRGFATCLRQALRFDALGGLRKDVANILRGIASELDGDTQATRRAK